MRVMRVMAAFLSQRQSDVKPAIRRSGRRR
jgi:hypothetical protein